MKIKKAIDLRYGQTQPQKGPKRKPFPKVAKPLKTTKKHKNQSIFDMVNPLHNKAQFKASHKVDPAQSQIFCEEVVKSHGVVKISQLIPNIHELSFQIHELSFQIHELSFQIHELIETMAHFVKVESQNGVATTTIFLEIEGSVFDESQIVIDHYDTAPQSFNLRLSGTPEAVDLFEANLALLRTSLQTHEILKGFQIQLFPPLLSEKSDLRLRGKEKKKKIFENSFFKKIPLS